MKAVALAYILTMWGLIVWSHLRVFDGLGADGQRENR